ncbi:helix-turn-helix domain-containing protein [Kineococcus gypseus]|uniref:helix-turn-helix domain-containing protein n=1 Tax=Kineococcus gypseus TaxID=1637102 RepID=UPI003D7C9D32
MHNAGNAAETAASAEVRSVLLELLGDVDVLAERFLAQLLQVVPYSDGAVAREVLLRDAVATCERVLRRLVGLPVPERLVEVSRDLGRHRAGLDVPLAAVTTGTRLHFRVVWEELAERLPPHALAGAVTLPVQLWQAVEEHSADVQVGYHEAAAALAYERERDRRRLLAAFLASDGEDPDLLAGAAAVLGAGRGDDVFVAVVPTAARGRLAPLLQRPGALRLLDHHAGTLVVGHRPRGAWPTEGPGLPVVPAPLSAVPCGLGPLARGLARVPRAVRLAEHVAAALPAEAAGPARLAHVALDVAAARLGALGEDVAHEVLGELLALAPPERERLLEVVEAFAATGSVAAAAARTYCHRNTVLNRLRRVGECTGLDVTVPRQAAALLLALAVHRRSGPAPG